MSIEMDSTLEEKTPSISPGTYSPVTVYMKDSIGAIFLGALTVILLINWRRAEASYHSLLLKQEITNGNHSLDSR